MMNKVLLLGYLIVNVFGCINTGNVDDALQAAIDNGADMDKLDGFYSNATKYVTSTLPDLQINSLLVSDMMKLYPDTSSYDPAYLNAKMVMYLKATVIDGDINNFIKYAVEVMFPENGFNSTDAQAFYDDIINGEIPSTNEFNITNDVLQPIFDYINIDPSITDILFWAHDNQHLAGNDPNHYFKYLLDGLLDNFVLPIDAEELGRYILANVTIVNDTASVRLMIRDFLGSQYIPDSIAPVVSVITSSDENWQQFITVTAYEMIGVMEYKYAESELSETFNGTEWENEWNSIQTLLSDYILANYTQILYIDQPGGIEYIYNQMSAYINSSNITDGFKELYNLLLKLPKNGYDMVPIYEELVSFFETTNITNTELSDALVEIFEFAIDEVNNVTSAEATFWVEMREYINSLPLQESTQMWFNESFQQTNLTSFNDLLSLLFDNITGQINVDEIQNLALLVIDVADKDYDTFGNVTGLIWPNNLIDNMNRIASTIEYFGSNFTENDVYQITDAVFISINDMFAFDYPLNAYLNITAQILPKIISPEANEYYFGTTINPVPSTTSFSFTPFQTTSEPQREGGNPEAFVEDVLYIIENTLNNSMTMRDLIDTAQLYLDLNTFDVTTFDGLIEFICDETKDITKELCIVFEMVNATVTLINEFSSGFSNFTYKNSITDIANTIHLPEYLPFLEHLVDALVSTFYPNEGATIISSIEATRQYWTSSNITSNNIINLIESIGNLYLLDDIALQNKWKYTILYVEEIFNNTDIILNSNIDELINILKGITRAPTSPTYMPSISPSKTPTSYPSKMPTLTPSITPTLLPSMTPSKIPTLTPSISPTLLPSMTPTKKPTLTPTLVPTLLTKMPSWSPTIPGETRSPSFAPTKSSDTPSINTNAPTMEPTTRFDVTTSSNGSSYQFYSKWLCFIFVLTYFVF